MKVKKLLIGFLILGLVLSFAGCGDKVINDSGEKVQSFGQFIEFKEIKIVSSNGYIFNQYFVYDKTTKIVYVVQGSDRYGGIGGITPYYILDENGKPEITVYGENYNG